MYEDLAQDFNNILFKIYEYILYNIYLYIKYVYYLYIHYILIGFKTQSPISVMCIWIWDHPRTAYQQLHTPLKKNDSHFVGAMNFQQLLSLGWSLVSRPPHPIHAAVWILLILCWQSQLLHACFSFTTSQKNALHILPPHPL